MLIRRLLLTRAQKYLSAAETYWFKQCNSVRLSASVFNEKERRERPAQGPTRSQHPRTAVHYSLTDVPRRESRHALIS